MTDPFRRFPDVQKLLVTDLEALLGTDHTGIETPGNLADVLPFARVLRTGGPSDQLNDLPTVEIDVFGSLYSDVELMAERVRQRLVGPPPPIPLIDSVECVLGPRELPWGDGVVRRFSATYHLTARRHTVLI